MQDYSTFPFYSSIFCLALTKHTSRRLGYSLLPFLVRAQVNRTQKEASKHRFRRIGVFTFFLLLQIFAPFFVFCDSFSYNYLTFFNSSCSFLSSAFFFLAISPSPILYVAYVCVARPCQRLARWGPVPITPQAFSPALSPTCNLSSQLSGLSTDSQDVSEQISSE
ncbi:hypothetical protein EV426DRAFT_307677 [Tirmania nivea]|nr:hypothetical protein EV426DRAFT_307677 [Tirmania nivea]